MNERDIMDALLNGATVEQLQEEGVSICDINVALENWEKRIS